MKMVRGVTVAAMTSFHLVVSHCPIPSLGAHLGKRKHTRGARCAHVSTVCYLSSLNPTAPKQTLTKQTIAVTVAYVLLTPAHHNLPSGHHATGTRSRTGWTYIDDGWTPRSRGGYSDNDQGTYLKFGSMPFADMIFR